jgi:predicted RNA-binding Zn ribbon-like protein
VAGHGHKPDRSAIGALGDLSERLPVTVRIGDGPRPTFRPGRRDTAGALGLVLALVATAMLDGTWERMKACRECRWVFYDHSRNAAGSWCSMAVCGGRVKQRAYYRRGKSPAGP